MKNLILVLIAGLFIISCDKNEQEDYKKSIFTLEYGEFASNSLAIMNSTLNRNKMDFNKFNSDLFYLVKTDFPEADFLSLEINAGLKNTYLDLSSIKKLIYTYSVNEEEDLKLTFLEDKVLYSITKEKNKNVIGHINDIDCDIYSIVNRLIDTTYGVSYLENILIRQQTKTATSPEYKGGPLAIFYQGDDINYVSEALAYELVSKKYFRIFKNTGDF
ncbi:hypothetical protein EZS27_022354 [termite gut metagenome]|uniref:Uncharacterized protein n=1 Tax=termite gut metagenome TaxID=433724 RepID=A0A5J4R510_9ZZZZ